MEINDTKLGDMTIKTLIRLMREIAMLGVLVFLSVKLFSGELSLDFAKLTSTELLNLLLAFFSIALSAAFYFAATSQSNQFYDNVNKFSKDTSELLGRLDEQVKGIGGRQTELKDSIDKYYYRGGKNVNSETDKTVEAAEKVQDRLSKLVSEMLDKANLTSAERLSFEEQLKERDAQLRDLQEKIGRESSDVERRVRSHIRSKLKREGLGKAVDTPPDELLFKLAKSGPIAFVRDLNVLKWITSDKVSSPSDVTESGKNMVSSIIEGLINSESA